MNKFKIIPLVAALSTIGLLTGCFDKKDEVKPEVKTEIKQESKQEVAPVTQAATPEVKQEASVEPTQVTEEAKPEFKAEVSSNVEPVNTIAITPEELPADFFAPLVENKDYLKVAIDPAKNLVDASYNKPVIVDFFWYGCGHCNAMRPLMEGIIKSNPDVLTVKYPAAFPNWESGTKLYFGYKQLNLLEQLHDSTFDALHVQRRNLLGNTEQLEKFLKEKNVDLAKFNATQSSFQMSRDLLRAKDVTAQYQLKSTPNMGVYYKGYAYLVNPSLSLGYENTARSVKVMLSKFTPEQIQGK